MRGGLLAVLLAATPAGANATPTSLAADEVRERLRAFGTVCRAGEACPQQAAASTALPSGPNWKVVEPEGDPAEMDNQGGVRSGWASSGMLWPETSASIAVSSGMDTTMRFTYLNLADGEKSRYGAWENHWITLEAGELQKEFQVRLPADQPSMLLLGTGPAHFIAQALRERAGETLTIRMQYRGEGAVEFAFPLQGAAESLHTVGLIDESVMAALAGEAGDTAAEAEPAPAATPAALTATGGPRSGQQIYNTFCFACHATGVSDAPLFGSLEKWQPYIDKGMDELVATSLTGLNLMPPMGTCMSCSEDEMRDAIQYMIDSAH